MKQLRRLISFSLIPILILILHNYTYAQSVVYVSQNGAGTKDGTSWANAYDGSNLQTAINAVSANAGGQVWVTVGTYYPTQDETGNVNPSDARLKTFTLQRNVALYGGFEGVETTLAERQMNDYSYLSGDIGIVGNSADNSYNVVYSNNVDSTAILDYFFISNGNATGNSVVRTISGGGAFLQGGYINNCAFEYNNALLHGGGVNMSADTKISNSSFYQNTAEFGAAAYLMDGGTLFNSTIQYNTASCTGGGISIETKGTVDGCYVYGNTSNGTSTTFTFSEGGGIDASGSDVKIVNSSILNNTCTSSQGSAYGGGLICSGGVLVSNCIIKGNNCSNGVGGGLYFTNSKIENSTIANNTAGAGGGIYSQSSSIITNCLINNNTAKYDGGGISVNGNGTTITNATIANNLSYTITTPASIQLYVSSTAPGSCNLINTVLTSPTAPAIKTSIPVSFTVNQTNCATDGNEICNITCAGFKKATSFTGASTTLAQTNELNAADWGLLSTSTLINNGTADTTGLSIPTIDVVGSPRISINRIDIGAYEYMSIRYVTVSGAGLKTGSGWANALPGDSLQYALNLGLGEVRVAAGTYKPKYDANGTLSSASPQKRVFTIAKKVILYGGFAGTETDPLQRQVTDLDGNGKIESWEYANQTILSGDIGVVGDSTDNCNHIIAFTTNSSLASDSATVNGVTITSSMSGTAVSITNTASNDRIINCTITNASGGGVTITGKAKLSGCSISKNMSGIGAGVFFNGGGFVDNCKIDGNFGATNGTGLYFSNGGKITNSIVSNNSGYVGGGAYISSSGTIDNCIIAGNSASSSTGSPSGGGIEIYGDGTVTNSFIYNNYSSSYGGGIEITNAGTIANCVIVNNTSSSSAGGVTMGGQASRLLNCTLANNSYSDLTLNGASNSSTVINTVITGSSTITGSNLTFMNNAIAGGYNAGKSTIALLGIADARFIKPTSFTGRATNAAQLLEIQNADWSLSAESPLINSGSLTDSTVKSFAVDIAGNKRVNLGAFIDIGALELQSIVAPASVSNITAVNNGVGIVALSWNQIQGVANLALVKEGSTGIPTITAGTSFKADTVFTDGETPDGSWFSMYDGKLNSVTISNLTPGTWYRAAIDAYNGINFKVYSANIDGQNVVKFFAKMPQDITFNAPLEIDGQTSFIPDALASSNLKITFTSSDSSVALPYGNSIQILKPGTVTITAYQEGNNQYFAATPVSKTIVLGKAMQTINFTMNNSATYGDADIALNATSTSGLPVQFTSGDNNIASVANGWISFKSAGTVVITAIQPGNNYFTQASAVAYTLTINKATQKMNFGSLASKTFGDAGFALTANASSGLPVSFVSSDNSVVSLAGNIATIHGGGTITIKAYQIGNNNYQASDTISQTLVIAKKIQSIVMDSIVPITFGSDDFAPVIKTESDSVVVLSSDNESVASIVNGKIHLIGVGTATIVASQNGTTDFLPATTSRIVTVIKSQQTISFATIGVKTFTDSLFVLEATSNSGLPISFTSNNSNILTIQGDTVLIKSSGKADITASQQGNNNYEAAGQVIRTVTVLPAEQSITFNQLDTISYGSTAEIIPVVASSSGLPVSLTSFDLSVAKIVNGKIVIVGAGSTVIAASQNGNINYNQAAQIKQVLVVNQLTQTLQISAIPSLVYGSKDISVTASASSSLPISITSEDPTIVQVVNNKLRTIQAGMVKITISQLGNGNYVPIDSTITVTVAKAAQTITFPAIPIKKVGTIPFKLFATSSSGYPVTYKSTNPTIADLVENEVTIYGPGACKIIATVDSSVNYLAASDTNTIIVTALNDLKMPLYTLTRDTIINLNSLVLTNDKFDFVFVSGNHASAVVSGDSATIKVKKDNSCWTGIDTLLFIATNRTVAGDVQMFGIKISRIPLVEEIGLVTVDSTTSTNCIISWERSQNAQIAGYILYRGGNSAGQWDSIGFVKSNQRSLFVDTKVNVQKQAYQYAMVTVDSCGNLSAKSAVHTTMHLMTGVNLQNIPQLWWTPYVGADIEAYIIYRKNQTTGKLDSIGSSILTSYTDVDAPSGTVDYRVAIRFAKTIDPSHLKSDSGPFSQSLSNMAESQLTKATVVDNNGITISPNPAKDIITISSNDVISGDITIRAIDGTVVKTYTNEHSYTSIQLEITGLTSGVYTLQFKTEKGITNRKIIILN